MKTRTVEGVRQMIDPWTAPSRVWDGRDRARPAFADAPRERHIGSAINALLASPGTSAPGSRSVSHSTFSSGSDSSARRLGDMDTGETEILPSRDTAENMTTRGHAHVRAADRPDA